MKTEKELVELVKGAYEVTIDSFKISEHVNEIFYNAKAHLEAQEQIEDAIKIANGLLVEHGQAKIEVSMCKKGIKIKVGKTKLAPEIPKHFDLDLDDLYYSCLDFLSQLYEEGGFSTTIIFLNKDRTEAEIDVNL